METVASKIGKPVMNDREAVEAFLTTMRALKGVSALYAALIFTALFPVVRCDKNVSVGQNIKRPAIVGEKLAAVDAHDFGAAERATTSELDRFQAQFQNCLTACVNDENGDFDPEIDCNTQCEDRAQVR